MDPVQGESDMSDRRNTGPNGGAAGFPHAEPAGSGSGSGGGSSSMDMLFKIARILGKLEAGQKSLEKGLVGVKGEVSAVKSEVSAVKESVSGLAGQFKIFKWAVPILITIGFALLGYYLKTQGQ